MQRSEKRYYSKRRSTKLTSNKHINKRKTCYLEIQVSEIQDKTIICTAPIVEIEVPKRINGKCVRRIVKYRIIGKSKDSEWKIEKITPSFKTPNNLINSKIVVTNGKKVVSGTIIKASIVGGGATSPATGDGLPHVDE